MNKHKSYDAIVVGAGMGGMTTACLLAKEGYHVAVLEAAHVPGGCSSSYKRKGYIFESGATTLIGFDEYQPLQWLEQTLNITLNKWPISPPMTVHANGRQITRYREIEAWVDEAQRVFGNAYGQTKFWRKAYKVGRQVWKLSAKNHFFPPANAKDILKLADFTNLKYLPVLRYNFKTVAEVARECNIDTPECMRFLDEQLMITAQATADSTPFLFGAPALTYTNSMNYYVPGGLLNLIRELQNYLERKHGELHCRSKVKRIHQTKQQYRVITNDEEYTAPVVISNIPIWNMPEITTGEIKNYYQHLSSNFDKAWGAVTMGIVTDDTFSEAISLHHQILLPAGQVMPFTGARSVFVSISHPDDIMRSKNGKRVLNVSCHTYAERWFSLNGAYDQKKELIKSYIMNLLDAELPGFTKDAVELAFLATPVTWQNWVYRKFGRVGGLPQGANSSLLGWPANKTPFKGLYVCGDTIFPGQGIPGVTLSGINTYHRIIHH